VYIPVIFFAGGVYEKKDFDYPGRGAVRPGGLGGSLCVRVFQDRYGFKIREAGTVIPNEVRFLDALNFQVSAGYAFDFGLRLEADIFSVRLRQKGLDFSDAFFVALGVWNIKGLWDIVSYYGFTPYIGAGLSGGLGLLYINSNKEFSCNILGIAGVSYTVTGGISVLLEYDRTFWFDNNGTGPASSHNGTYVFKLGVMYRL
jgi:opacity protein-like surface antigen